LLELIKRVKRPLKIDEEEPKDRVVTLLDEERE